MDFLIYIVAIGLFLYFVLWGFWPKISSGSGIKIKMNIDQKLKIFTNAPLLTEIRSTKYFELTDGDITITPSQYSGSLWFETSSLCNGVWRIFCSDVEIDISTVDGSEVKVMLLPGFVTKLTGIALGLTALFILMAI